MGEFESLNFSIGIIPQDIALFHALYRTSVKGRKDLINLMFSDDESLESINVIDSNYTSRVAEIFNVVLKSLGIKIEYLDTDNIIEPINNTIMRPHVDENGKTFLCTDWQYFIYQRTQEIKDEILSKYPIMTVKSLNKMIEKELKSDKYIVGSIKDELEWIDYLPSEEDLKVSQRILEEVFGTNEEPEQESETNETTN